MMSVEQKATCPQCSGSGDMNRKFPSPLTVQNDKGEWVDYPYCTMCLGHGYVLVRSEGTSTGPI